MEQYLEIVDYILTDGKLKENRTGTPAITVSGLTFEHDMSEGYPLLTTKKIPFNLVASELEFFLKGLTDKRWLQERGNHIWDEWCNPQIVPYGHDDETKRKMEEERDLGPIYGWQWRHFGAEYRGPDADYKGEGFDQLEDVVNKLHNDPNNRRMIVSSWNPLDFDQMALKPCHYTWQATVIDDRIDLVWNQRSVDTMLGLPFNIASYGLLLHLLAEESGYEPGHLTGQLGDVHVYENHVEGAREQLSRDPTRFSLPTVHTDDFTSIFDWEYTDSRVEDYEHYPHIKFEIAV